MGLFDDIAFGAISGGVNISTLLCLNVVLFLCISSMIAWLVVSISAYPFLVPHIAFLLFMAIALSILINWFVLNAGLVDPKKQQEELGLGETSAEKPPSTTSPASKPEKKD
ncbi:hypothetical protein BSKO_03251 [Bryopsis sp. KO-2023]|nr:hypothetical protein BSKO_03251 [Bryopsis sp. KO-2023]